MYIIVCYAAYLAISLAATVWVARTLHQNGRAFLVDAFQGDAQLAKAVNHLLVLGFCLVNAGCLILAAGPSSILGTTRQAMDVVCDTFGRLLLVLGLVHFLALYVLSRFRGQRRERYESRRINPTGGGAWGREGAPIGKVLD